MTQELTLLQANLKALGAALAAVGMESATIRYEGSGDSGDICDFTVNPFCDVALLGDVTYQQKAWSIVDGENVKGRKDVTADFESAFSDVLWDAIREAGRDGFENNEGGEGALTVYASGFGVLNHSDNFEGEADHDTRTFTAANTEHGASLANLAKALRDAGYKAAYAEYTGSGDSGDGFDIGYTAENEGDEERDVPGEVAYATVSREYDSTTQRILNVERETKADFETAFADVAFLFIEDVMNHRGWENNEGGGGEVTLMADGTLHVDHYDNGEADSASQTFSWNEELATDEEREDAEEREGDEE